MKIRTCMQFVVFFFTNTVFSQDWTQYFCIILLSTWTSCHPKNLSYTQDLWTSIEDLCWFVSEFPCKSHWHNCLVSNPKTEIVLQMEMVCKYLHVFVCITWLISRFGIFVVHMSQLVTTPSKPKLCCVKGFTRCN